MNPNAIEVGVNAQDDDCDNLIDEPPTNCDGGVSLDTENPYQAALAMDACKLSTGRGSWGLVEARWVMADGSPPPTNKPQLVSAFHLGHGVLDNFGPNVVPKSGTQLLALSNGRARRPGDADYQVVTGGQKNYASPLPASFPKPTTGCSFVPNSDATDPIGLELVLRAPSNAHGFAFYFDFYAADFPQYVCTMYNDAFAALVFPPPAGLSDANVAFFGPAKDVFSLNGAPFDVCECDTSPCIAGGKSYACSQGTAQLLGNGFGHDVDVDRGATGWQRTTVPVVPDGEFTVRFTVWDRNDGSYSSTTLIDGWHWLTDTGVTTQTVPAP